MVNSGLNKALFLGGVLWKGGGWLISHNWLLGKHKGRKLGGEFILFNLEILIAPGTVIKQAQKKTIFVNRVVHLGQGYCP